MMSKEKLSIVMLGCFDTKGEDFSFLYQCLKDHGENIIAINTGVMPGTQRFTADYDSDMVAEEAGVSIQELREKRDRGKAVDAMSKGAAGIVRKLVSQGRVKGAIGMGGGAGTFIALTAMQGIPLGIPKFCLSTLAGKDVARQLGSKDITLMPSIVDVAGLNSISKRLITHAAAAICAMSNVKDQGEETLKGRIAISMFGNTTACVDRCTQLLKEKDYEVFAFHANGTGGRTMESLIRERCFDAVLDVTTTELADELCGGICSAGPDRLTAASGLGIPQVVVPGCLDMVNFAQPDTVPARYKNREFYSWAPDVTLLRTNVEENTILGETLAVKLNASRGPVSIYIPNKGLSQIDAEGGIFFRPEADRALFDTIKAKVSSKIKVTEMDLHINDAKFAEALVGELLHMLENKKATQIA